MAICNFSLHYFYEKELYLCNFIETIDSYLSKGGYFIGIMPDGDRIHRLLEKNNGNVSVLSDKTEYSIKTLYRNYNRRNVFSKKISVLLEDSILSDNSDDFSNDYSGRLEYLANFYTLKDLLEERNIELIESSFLSDIYDTYRTTEKRDRELSDKEKMFSFTYRYFIFKKRDIIDLDIINQDVNNIIVDDRLSSLPKPFHKGELSKFITFYISVFAEDPLSIIMKYIMKQKDTLILNKAFRMNYLSKLGLSLDESKNKHIDIFTHMTILPEINVNIIVFTRKNVRVNKKIYASDSINNQYLLLIEEYNKNDNIHYILVKYRDSELWQFSDIPFNISNSAP